MSTRFATPLARRAAILALAGSALPASGQSLFSTVGGQFQAVAGNLGQAVAFLPLTQPGPGSTQATYSETMTSGVGYSFGENAGHSELDITFAHNCSYTLGGSRAFTYSDGHFTSPASTAYTIAGIFSVPPGQHAADLSIEVNLLASPGGSLFHFNTSRTLPGGSSIVVGVPISGDTLTGSATGTLAAGVTYTLALNISTNNTNFGAGGITSSGSISVALAAPCYANCDGSTTVPVLNVNDFACFINRYSSGDTYANCDGSSTPPVLNVLDFACFLNRFAAGCP